jgi:hypothetical protein
MQYVHLANTDFEFELSQPPGLDTIESTWNRFPICLQLQFLPLLFADEQDAIVVTQIPEAGFIEQFSYLTSGGSRSLPSFIRLSDSPDLTPYDRCLSWGVSNKVREWAFNRGLPYLMPEWTVVREINSKSFSFNESPILEGASLLRNENELRAWLSATPGRKVLKTCFGMSGKGHHFLDSPSDLKPTLAFCSKEWLLNRPLLGEPWVDRVFDFSTQWYLDPNEGIRAIGSTICENNIKGVYEATLAGPEEVLFKNYADFLREHKKVVIPLLERILRKGFFGFLGVDAFVYQKAGGPLSLHPVVEINGRQTMSLAALRFQRRFFPNRTLRFFFGKGPSTVSLLPDRIINSFGREIVFNRHLTFSFLSE